MALDYAPNGKSFCTAGKDNIIRIYDEESKAITNQLSGIKWHTHGHNNRIFSVKFKPDDQNILISGGWDQNVTIFIKLDKCLGYKRGKFNGYYFWSQNRGRFNRHQRQLNPYWSKQRN